VPTPPLRFDPSAMPALPKVSGSLETGPPSPPAASPSSSRAWSQPTPHSSSSSSWQEDTSTVEVPSSHELDDVAHVPWLLFRLILNTAALGADANNSHREATSNRSTDDKTVGGKSTVIDGNTIAGPLRLGHAGSSSETTMNSATSPPGSSSKEAFGNNSSISIRACELVPNLLQLMASARLPGGVDEAVHCVATLIAALRRYRGVPQHSPWCLAALRALNTVASDARFGLDLRVAFLGNNDDTNAPDDEAALSSFSSSLPEVSALGNNEQGLYEQYQSASQAALHTLLSALGCSTPSLSGRSYDGNNQGQGDAWANWDEFTDCERRETLRAEATYVETVVTSGVRNQVATVKQYEAAHEKSTQAALATLRAQAVLSTSTLRADEAARLCEVCIRICAHSTART